jgi:hypothetical protein
MAKALSMDLRERVLAVVDAGASCRQAAAPLLCQRLQCDPLVRARRREHGMRARSRKAALDVPSASRRRRRQSSG